MHPRLLEGLVEDRVFFPYTATLEQNLGGRLPSGAPTYDWQTVPGYSAIPCTKESPMRYGHETRTPDMIIELDIFEIGLAGFYPDIQEAWRIRLNTGDIYDIVASQVDGLGIWTVLQCRRVTTSAEAGV